MPRASYRVPLEDVEIVAAFPTPKRVGDIDEWLRSAAEALPDAEAFKKSRRGSSSRYVLGAGWALSDKGANERVVSFEFMNGQGVRAYLTIDRKFNTVGARV